MVRTRFDIFCTYVLSFSVKFFLRFFYIFLRRNSVGKVGGGCAFPGVATDVIPPVSQKQINLKMLFSSRTETFKRVTK